MIVAVLTLVLAVVCAWIAVIYMNPIPMALFIFGGLIAFMIHITEAM